MGKTIEVGLQSYKTVQPAAKYKKRVHGGIMKKTTDSTGSSSLPDPAHWSKKENARAEVLDQVLETEAVEEEESQKRKDKFLLEGM